MKLLIDKQINGNIYSVNMKFGEFGSPTITAEEEKELLQDFVPQFNLRDIEFKGKYIYDEKLKMVNKYEEKIKSELSKDTSENNGIEIEDEKNDDLSIGEPKVTISDKDGNIILSEEDVEYMEVSAIINDKVVKIDEELQLTYIIKSSQVVDKEVGNSLKDKGLVAQAKVQLFTDKIVEKITKVMEELKDRRTKFEKEEEVVI